MRANISQRKLGLKVGFDAEGAGPRMNQYEAGSHIPRFPVPKKIAEALDIPTSYLFEEDDNIAKAILAVGELNAKNQKTAVEFAEMLGEKDKNNR